jgi:nucleotide-binding universal stress UspA family protein
MFKNILIPTDGSPVATKAARAGIQLAKALDAKVTGYYAVEEINPLVFSEGYIPDPELVSELERRARAYGEETLAALQKIADKAGVSFKPVVERADVVHEGILRAARKNKCDLIFIGSHGRRGIVKLVLGSVTEKVLANATTPVTVYRAQPR